MTPDKTNMETRAQEKADPRKGPRFQTFSSLSNRDFRLLWAGNLFEHMALWLQLISLSWLVWDLSGSALLSGLVPDLEGCRPLSLALGRASSLTVWIDGSW